MLKEIRGRLGFLTNVGLDYLALDRAAPTLSGGEAQRIRLAGQIGCGLVGVLYILDEPSIGLHPARQRPAARHARTAPRLGQHGDRRRARRRDDARGRPHRRLRPGPGRQGGEVVAAGTIATICRRAPRASPASICRAQGDRRSRRTQAAEASDWLKIVGARHNNLERSTSRFPLGLFVCVTGVSGSGKSSLVSDILRDTLARDLNRRTEPGLHDGSRASSISTR